MSSAQGSARVTQPSHRFFQSAAIANAKGTESDANPMNMTGGWITIHGSWSKGFRPTPSAGAGGGRSLNGLCLQRIATTPRNVARYTTMTGASCSFALRQTKSPMIAPQNSQSRKEPSWPPQKVEMRKCSGRSRLEYALTYDTSKRCCSSSVMRTAEAATMHVAYAVKRLRASGRRSRRPRSTRR